MDRKSAVLIFPRHIVDRPVISRVVQRCAVEVNILQATITPEDDGRMFAVFSGEPHAISTAFAFLVERGVLVSEKPGHVLWQEESCVHCTACTGQCPTSALSVDSVALLHFDAAACIACEQCVPACGYGALHAPAALTRRGGVL
jgi:ferredoxin